MALLISTNMYKAEEFKRILSYVEMEGTGGSGSISHVPPAGIRLSS